MIRLLKTRNFNLLFQRAKTEIAEIDLIFENGKEVILVEVKTLSSAFSAFERVHKRQLQKLKANRVYLSARYPLKKITSYVAFVEADQKISFCCVD